MNLGYELFSSTLRAVKGGMDSTKNGGKERYK